jgi:hypothetical protein
MRKRKAGHPAYLLFGLIFIVAAFGIFQLSAKRNPPGGYDLEFFFTNIILVFIVLSALAAVIVGRDKKVVEKIPVQQKQAVDIPIGATALFSELRSEGKSEAQIREELWGKGYTQGQIDALLPMDASAQQEFTFRGGGIRSTYVIVVVIGAFLYLAAHILYFLFSAGTPLFDKDHSFGVSLMLFLAIFFLCMAYIVYSKRSKYGWDITINKDYIVFFKSNGERTKFPLEDLSKIKIRWGTAKSAFSGTKFFFKDGKEFDTTFPAGRETLMESFIENAFSGFKRGYRKEGSGYGYERTYTLTGGTQVIDTDLNNYGQIQCVYCGSSSYKTNAQCWKCNKKLDSSRAVAIKECKTCGSLNKPENKECWVCGEIS